MCVSHLLAFSLSTQPCFFTTRLLYHHSTHTFYPYHCRQNIHSASTTALSTLLKPLSYSYETITQPSSKLPKRPSYSPGRFLNRLPLPTTSPSSVKPSTKRGCRGIINNHPRWVWEVAGWEEWEEAWAWEWVWIRECKCNNNK